MVSFRPGFGLRRIGQKRNKFVLPKIFILVLTGVFLVSCSTKSGDGGSTQGKVGGEANLVLPDLSSVRFFNNAISGHTLLLLGLIVCAAGLIFGIVTYSRLKRMPVHKAMLEISELIYSTCKAYLLQQIRFVLILWAFIAAIILVYYKILVGFEWGKTLVILSMSLIGMAGSCAIAWFGIRVNTFANARTAHASLQGRAYPCHQIPMESGMSVGMVLISIELAMMLVIMVFLPGDLAGPSFIGFAIGESLGAAALRIAGGIFTKIADIGADLMKIEFGIKEDDARNPGVIADCVGDNAGDSVGPSADGFETYGVTGVALITFILLAVNDPTMQVHLLVWVFFTRVVMVIAAYLSYVINAMITRVRYTNSEEMNFEAPLSSLVWLTSIVCVGLTYLTSYLMNSDLDSGLWWKLATIISCGTLAGAIIPELVKSFTSTQSRHVREVVISSNQGGASLGVLSGLVAGNFSALWLGGAIVSLMGVAFGISTLAGFSSLMLAPSVFAFGLVAFGFLGMGPVTIAVDSYGPVTDNAQSVYELSTIEQLPDITDQIEKDFGFTPRWDKAKYLLEANDSAGNTFKATAKPVLIGTAVVGATTMIFSIVMNLTSGLTVGVANLSMLHAPFLLGLIIGGAIIFWFSGASMQAVSTGSYRAVDFIKRNINLSTGTKASKADSTKVVQICTQYAQRGMLNIFIAVFFATLAFAFVEPFLFIGYLVSIAIFGLYQAIFMANTGGAWDNAKKIVEVDLDAKGTALHEAAVIGDTIGDPFKDTSSVSLNPIIKFSTLFGLLAVELAVEITANNLSMLAHVLAAGFLLIALVFIYRSFYSMRIGLSLTDVKTRLSENLETESNSR